MKCFFSEFHYCFGEIGTLNTTHHIEVKDNVKPVVTPVLKVPHALKPKLEKELKRMVHLDIIEPIEKSTDWVNGLVIIEKPNGKLRICLYSQPLNNAIKREHLHVPTAEEILSQMSGACFFSKLDASLGYWQIKVDEESPHLLTFGATLARYRFKGLPYGIHSPSEVFRPEITSIISTATNTVITPNFLVWKFCGKAQFPHCFGRFARNYRKLCLSTKFFRSIQMSPVVLTPKMI